MSKDRRVIGPRPLGLARIPPRGGEHPEPSIDACLAAAMTRRSLTAAAVIAPWRTIPISLDVMMDLGDDSIERVVTAFGGRLRVCDPYMAANWPEM